MSLFAVIYHSHILSGIQNIQNSLAPAVIRAVKLLIIFMHIHVTKNIKNSAYFLNCRSRATSQRLSTKLHNERFFCRQKLTGPFYDTQFLKT